MLFDHGFYLGYRHHFRSFSVPYGLIMPAHSTFGGDADNRARQWVWCSDGELVEDVEGGCRDLDLERKTVDAQLEALARELGSGRLERVDSVWYIVDAGGRTPVFYAWAADDGSGWWCWRLCIAAWPGDTLESVLRAHFARHEQAGLQGSETTLQRVQREADALGYNLVPKAVV
jgi:hypothetical protein